MIEIRIVLGEEPHLVEHIDIDPLLDGLLNLGNTYLLLGEEFPHLLEFILLMLIRGMNPTEFDEHLYLMKILGETSG